jgi:membrane associated rhomboid family serine protease
MAPSEHRIRFQQGGGGLSPVILNLLIANGIFFLLQLVSEHLAGPRQWPLIERWLSLWPLFNNTAYEMFPFRPWQLLSYGFLHGGIGHIAINMLVLWMFGSPVAADLGERRFLIYYLLCVIGAGICHLLVPLIGVPAGPVVGASGGTMGLLLAFGWRFPNTQIMLLIPPIPMKARVAVFVFGAMELFYGFSGLRTGVAHFAHLGGLFTGILILAYWRGKLPFKPKRLLP